MQDERINIKVNKSKIYFTPLFNQLVPIKYFRLLKNTYFWYDDFKEDCFCLLYKFDGAISGSFRTREGFTVYENTMLTNNVYFKGYRDFGEYVLFQFEIPEELIEVRNLLLEGKYSQISEYHKGVIVQFTLNNYGTNDANFIRQILYKDETLRRQKALELGYPMVVNGKIKNFPDIELASVLDPENELFSNFVEEKEKLKRDEF